MKFATRDRRDALPQKYESYLDRVSTGSGSDLVQPSESKILAAELPVESPHRRFGFVLKFSGDEFTCFSCQITNRLFITSKQSADGNPTRTDRVLLLTNSHGELELSEPS